MWINFREFRDVLVNAWKSVSMKFFLFFYPRKQSTQNFCPGFFITTVSFSKIIVLISNSDFELRIRENYFVSGSKFSVMLQKFVCSPLLSHYIILENKSSRNIAKFTSYNLKIQGTKSPEKTTSDQQNTQEKNLGPTK